MISQENDIQSASVDALTEQNDKFNHVWWLPLMALLMVAYVAINHYTSKGALINITFSTAEGLEAGKTKVRYKDVIIGVVEKISFDTDYKAVKVSVRMNKDSEGLLRQNTRFWVIKPRIGITQITGLNTLLSGNYITMEPDKNPQSPFRYDFEALEAPPIISQDEPGLKITLLSNRAASLYPGTAVYYKGMTVGSVNRVYFSDDYLWVKADIFIAAPHDKLINNSTKFWSSSGISIGASATGVEINMESVEALITGGITFATPVTLPGFGNDTPVSNGTEYLLYANEKAAHEQNTGRKQYFVSYFNSSIKGLEVGAPVMIQGMSIGKVKDIQLLFDEKKAMTRIPVLFEIYESRLRIIDDNDDNKPSDSQAINELTAHLVRDGLRTQLETGNLLTGSKYISLVFTEEHIADNRPALPLDPITGYRQLPSTIENFEAITAGVGSLVNQLNQLPLDDIANNLNNLLKTTDSTISSLTLKQTINEFNALLKEGKGLSKTANSTLTSLKNSVSALVGTTETTMAGFSADAPLYHNLNTTLEQLNETLAALRAVTEMLERNPNALVFGEDKPTKRPARQSTFGENRHNDR